MTTRRLHNENANAEIIGVVILIGIFAITAGIISATVLATPEAEKVPAASIEITNTSGNTLRIAHSGGDPLALDHLVLRGKIGGVTKNLDGASPTDNTAMRSLLVAPGDTSLNDGSIDNGFINSKTINTADGDALVLSWKDNSGGESVIASWDPTGIYGPLGPSTPSGGSVPGTPYVPVTPPTWPTPNTSWNANLHNLTAGFTVNPSAAVTGFEFEFTDASTGNVTIDSWLWNFGDGNTSTEHNVTHNRYSATGTYTVTLTISNQTFGVSDTIAMPGCVVVTGSPGAVDFSYKVYHPPGSMTLYVDCTDRSTSNPTLWRWTAEDGFKGDEPTVVGWLPLNSTNENVTCTDLNGIFDPRRPNFTFEKSLASELENRTIKLEIDSPYFEGPLALTKTVYVGPPKAEFSSNLTYWNTVSPQAVQFFDKSLGYPEAWSWDFESDGIIDSTEQNPTHVFTVGENEIRTYKVTLTVTGWGKSSSVTHDIAVYPPVVAKISSNISEGPAPLHVQFTDQSTGFPTKWLWDFGDNSSSTLQNPSHTFTKEGRYNVTLFAERATEPHSADLKIFPVFIRVGAPVTADFSGTPVNGTAPLAVQFTDLSTSADPIVSWAWDFESDGTIDSTEENPLHIYGKAGRYSVTLTTGNINRIGTVTKIAYVTVYEHVIASFTANQMIGMVPLTVRFTDTSTGNPTSWSWDFDNDGTIDSTERDPVHTYNAIGTYTVTLTASHAHSSNRTTKIHYIEVLSTPAEAQFTANQTAGPAPLTVLFTDTSTGSPTAWNWNFGDGTWFNTTTPADRSPTHTYATRGTYSVMLTTRQGTTTFISRPVNITVYDPIVAQMSVFNSDGRVPLAASFTDASTGDRDRWSWQFGDLTPNSTELNPVHPYTKGGIYLANLTVWNSLRPDLRYTASATIIAYDDANAAFTANVTSGIAPFAVRFTDNSTGHPNWWAWDFDGDGSVDSTEQNPTHVYTEGGTYLVTLHVGNPAGEDPSPATRLIVISEIFEAGFTANATMGPTPFAVQFTDISTGDGINSWFWAFGDGATSNVQSPVHIYTTAGPYTVTLTVTNATRSDSEVKAGYITVTYAPVLPTAEFSASATSGIAPLDVDFTDLSTGIPTSWAWDFKNDGSIVSNLQNPGVTYLDAGTYSVKLNVTNADGSDEEVKIGYITVIDPSAVLKITASAGAGGAISPAGQVDVSAGGSRTFTIVPNTGYRVTDVLVDGVSHGAITSYTFTNVLADHTIAASFAFNAPHTITWSKTGTGTITPSSPQTVNYGDSCSLLITASKWIEDVKIDGATPSDLGSSPMSYTASFTNVTANHTIVVTFK